MDILKTATIWKEAEMLSSAFFIVVGLCFISASLGFWQLGKTDVAKAYIIPTLGAGALLLIIGLGIFLPSQARATSFPAADTTNASDFIASEIASAERVLSEYRIAVFWIIPLIIGVCALLILYFQSPLWQASLITIIAMMVVVLTIDTNANARLEAYKGQLLLAKKQE